MIIHLQYEFKVKGIKKIRAHMYMSLDGVKVTRRKKNRVSAVGVGVGVGVCVK